MKMAPSMEVGDNVVWPTGTKGTVLCLRDSGRFDATLERDGKPWRDHCCADFRWDDESQRWFYA